MKVEWHPLARTDLANLMTYITPDDPEAAYQMHDDFRRQTILLATHPDMGRPGRLAGTRELVIPGTPYIAIFRVTRDVVTILRLLHGATKRPSSL